MFARSHAHHEVEFLKWFALVVIAGALALVLVGTAHGRETISRPPAMLPPEVEQLAKPMPLGSQTPSAVQEVPERDPFGLATEIWNAIEVHRSGHIDEAIVAWGRLRLPTDREVWRLVALAYAHLQNGDTERAAETLSEARYTAPDNPVVHYVLGTLWLMKAETAGEWYDVPAWRAARLVAWSPMDVAPNTQSMYRLAAMMAFQKAVSLAQKVDMSQGLLPAEWVVPESDMLAMPVAIPTVRDLLAAFGGDSFEGRSHLALGLMHMDRDVWQQAEWHLDRAAALGEPTGAAFRELGERFEQRGLHGDAMRAFLKALSHGGGINTIGDFLGNAVKALLR